MVSLDLANRNLTWVCVEWINIYGFTAGDTVDGSTCLTLRRSWLVQSTRTLHEQTIKKVSEMIKKYQRIHTFSVIQLDHLRSCMMCKAGVTLNRTPHSILLPFWAAPSSCRGKITHLAPVTNLHSKVRHRTGSGGETIYLSGNPLYFYRIFVLRYTLVC